MPVAKGKANTTTAIVLVQEQLDLVRRAALVRAMAGTKARVSVSDIIREALSAYAPKLEAELANYENSRSAQSGRQ